MTTLPRGLLIAAVLLALPARAAAAPHVVVRSGGLLPGSPVAGVEITPAGHARVLAGGRTRRLALSPAALARLRAAARRFLAAPPASVHAHAEDGGYVEALVQDGARTAGAIDTGAPSAAVTQLLAALPRRAGVREERDPPPPATAPCAPGKTPVEIEQHVPMAAATARGLIQLTPKGPISGDSVAVDGRWDRFKDLPVDVTVHLEIVHQPGDRHAYANEVRHELDHGYLGTATDDGQPLRFHFDVVDRAAGAAPRPCFDEVVMHPHDDVRSFMSGHGLRQLTGHWEYGQSWAWKHEVGHALGIDDRYKDFFVFKRPGHPDVELPDHASKAQIRQAIGRGVTLRDGDVISKPIGTTRDDFMGTARQGHLREDDARRLAMVATLVVHDLPGELLLNKDTGAQNLVVGAPFALSIPPLQTAHVDGMVAYCIDLNRRAPYDAPGFALDVLGRAGDLGQPGLAALQRVVDVVAAREPGSLQDTPGANAAIWRVTDDEPTDDPDALAILAAAGIPPDAAFAAPHFTDPAAALPGTVPVTLGT